MQLRFLLVALAVGVLTSHIASPVVEAAPDFAWGVGGVQWLPGTAAVTPTTVVATSGGATLVATWHQFSSDSAVVQRLTADGSIDSGFGTGGRLEVESVALGTSIAEVDQGLAVQSPSDRIVVAGRDRMAPRWLVAGWTSAGQPDNTFGSQGWADPLPSGWTSTVAPTITTDASGRLLVSGVADAPGDTGPSLVVVRLTVNGHLDLGYGVDGRTVITSLTTDSTGSPDSTGRPTSAGGAVTDPLGRLVVSGRSAAGDFVVRLSTTGGLDETFGRRGVSLMPDSGSCGDDMTVDDRGGLDLLCNLAIGTTTLAAVRRLDDRGSVDRSWGADGTAIVPRSAGRLSLGTAVAFASGQVVLVGSVNTSGRASLAWGPAVWRFTADGTLDIGAAPAGLEQPAVIGQRAVDVAVGPSRLAVLTWQGNPAFSPQGAAVVALVPSRVAATSSTVAIAPERLLDTRVGIGAPAGQVTGGHILELQVAGRAGIAADATAVALNVTATESTAAGFLTVFPCGLGPIPTASSLNWTAGRTVPNLVISGLGNGGRVCLYTNVATQLIADVTAWYPANSDYLPERPGRVLDTRTAGAAGRIGGTKVQRLGFDRSFAREITMNVTVVDPVDPGFLTVYPCDGDRPTTSNVAFTAGETVAALVTTALAADGSACVFSNTSVHLVVDTVGSVEVGGSPRPVRPVRLLDTRTTVGPASGVRSVPVAGAAAVAGDAVAVSLVVTATGPAADGYVTAYPCGTPIPPTSTLNVVAGETRANAAVVGVGTGGAVCVYSNVRTDLVVDLQEWLPPRG